MTLIAASQVPTTSKLRLAILYALRYQKLPGNSIAGVVEALIRNGVTADRARLVYIMLNFAGADVRQDDLFMNENFFSRGKTALKGLKVCYRPTLLTDPLLYGSFSSHDRVWKTCTRNIHLIWPQR